jgi:hypothetical protein
MCVIVEINNNKRHKSNFWRNEMEYDIYKWKYFITALEGNMRPIVYLYTYSNNMIIQHNTESATVMHKRNNKAKKGEGRVKVNSTYLYEKGG